jgi:hypothetical protein
MKIISHRGNLNGPCKPLENSIPYINIAINQGFDVEIDVRYVNERFYLGHDEPEYEVPIGWLVENKNKLLIHCKDIFSLDVLSQMGDLFHYFGHSNDLFVLTSKQYIITIPQVKLQKNSILVMPEFFNFKENNFTCAAVLTDYPLNYKNKIGI